MSDRGELLEHQGGKVTVQEQPPLVLGNKVYALPGNRWAIFIRMQPGESYAHFKLRLPMLTERLSSREKKRKLSFSIGDKLSLTGYYPFSRSVHQDFFKGRVCIEIDESSVGTLLNGERSQHVYTDRYPFTEQCSVFVIVTINP